MYLVIDIGNTNQKAALFDASGQLLQITLKKQLEIEDLEPWLSAYDIRASIISSVGNDNPKLSNRLSEQVPTKVFSSALRLPVGIQYATPKTLGTDRIANAVGANQLFPNENVLSIQVGSCLVTDLVTADNQYIGGTIAPGLRMRFRALEHFTAKLPLINPKPVDFLAGNSTEQSILSGVVNGLACEIDGLISLYTEQYSNLKVVMTGGDAQQLEGLLKNSIFAAPNLVLLGLYKILRFNAAE